MTIVQYRNHRGEQKTFKGFIVALNRHTFCFRGTDGSHPGDRTMSFFYGRCIETPKLNRELALELLRSQCSEVIQDNKTSPEVDKLYTLIVKTIEYVGLTGVVQSLRTDPHLSEYRRQSTFNALLLTRLLIDKVITFDDIREAYPATRPNE